MEGIGRGLIWGIIQANWGREFKSGKSVEPGFFQHFAANLIDKAIFVGNSDVWCYEKKCESENSSSFVFGKFEMRLWHNK
jgi:hypothetical protein